MDTQVLIAGGGPVGLLTAIELNKQGVKAILIEKNPVTTRHPKMDITNGRSMELFRRWGIDKKIKAIAVPEDHGFEVIWATQLAGQELVRFSYPTPGSYRSKAKAANNGTQTGEPAIRVSQILIEPCLKDHLETECPFIDIRYGWELESFVQDAEGVTATIKHHKTDVKKEIRSLYLAGCEGAGSVSRKILGITYKEIDVFGLAKKAGIIKLLGHAFREMRRGLAQPDGRIYMIHFTSPELKFFERFGPAWHIQSPNGSTIISQNDQDTWTLHIPLRKGEDESKIDPKAKLFECIGKEFDCTILIANAWTPKLSVVDNFGKGRVWMAGDAVRLVTPAGGYGMNTGVGDALALGWVLGAVIKGWGTTKLFEAYEAERRPVAIRNRDASGAHVLVRLKINIAMRDAMYEQSPKGEITRKKIAQKILALSNIENEAIGIEAGYRYEHSPVICYDSNEAPPPFKWDKLPASSYPGLRVPAIWLEDGRFIMDLLGDQFTLIRFVDMDVSNFEKAADKRRFPLLVLDIRDDHAFKVYARKLIMVRPDQHVCWRGDNVPGDVLEIIDKLRGA